ncbi:MAG: hypothetical protein ACK559_06340, partial [bacterium]
TETSIVSHFVQSNARGLRLLVVASLVLISVRSVFGATGWFTQTEIALIARVAAVTAREFSVQLFASTVAAIIVKYRTASARGSLAI